MLKKINISAVALFSGAIMGIAVTFLGLVLVNMYIVALGSIVGGFCFQQGIEHVKD